MKKVNLLLLIIVLTMQAATAADPIEKELKSEIKEVTVFLNGAQVLRKAETRLDKGRTILKFTGISPQIDEQSIQAQGEGDFTVLSVVHQLNYLKERKDTEEIENLQLQLKELRDKINFENNMLSVYTEEEKLILANRNIGGQQEGLKISELQAAADFYRTRLKEIKIATIEIKKTIRRYKEEVSKISKQLNVLNLNREKATAEILVAVATEKAVEAKFEIGYLVNNAAWYPTYDIRVENVNSPMDLTYKASVFQLSGEDWTDVKLTLSTADPRLKGIKPTLNPWRLNYHNPYAQRQNTNYNQPTYNNAATGTRTISGYVRDENNEPLIGATILVPGTTMGTVADIEGRYTLTIPNNAATLQVSYIGYNSKEVNVNAASNIILQEGVSLDEVVVTGYGSQKLPRISWDGLRQKKEKKKQERQQGQTIGSTNPVAVQQKSNAVNTEFEIQVPYTIPTDGKEYTVEIKQLEVPANYQYYCVPKLDLDAFLTARVTDWEDYDLMSGDVNLFFEGTFIGNSYLDVSNLSDTLEVSLGRDKSIVVERKKVKDFSKRKFLGSNKVDTRTWEITIRNKKSEPIDIIIQDQIPVSSVKDITVELEKQSNATYNTNTGELVWDLIIDKNTTKKLEFKYKVTYPKLHTLVLE